MNNSSRPNIIYSAALSEEPGTANTLLTSESTEIQIDSTRTREISQDLNQNQLLNSTSINMEYTGGDGADTRGRVGTSSVHQNFLTLFSEARSQFGRQSSLPNPTQRLHEHSYTHLERNAQDNEERGVSRHINYNQNANDLHHSNVSIPQSPMHSRNIRSWRMNLNNVLSFSSAPSTEAIRSLITSSGSFRYTPLNSNDIGDSVHLLMNQDNAQHSRRLVRDQPINADAAFSQTASRNSRSNSLRNDGIGSTTQTIGSTRDSTDVNNTNNVTSESRNPSITSTVGDVTSINLQQESVPGTLFSNRNQNTANRNNTLQEDEDNSVISDMFVKVLSHFVRYLPFICILFVKFVHDNLLGILDLLVLHGVMYHANKSLRDQISKFSQKSYGKLFRDFGLVVFVVAIRLLLASTLPDPFGLLIPPPSIDVKLESVNGEVSNESKQKLDEVFSNYLGSLKTVKELEKERVSSDNTVNVSIALQLGVLLFYVAVSDLMLKLITILVKISITLMPAKVIRHKPRARMYVLVEYFSQFYRALAPVRQWLLFLFESYYGVEFISGIIFSSFYLGAKGFEFVERGKTLKNAFINFLRNMDYERKPTKDELDAAGSLCPICHDAYSTPVVLECGHIFCDDCVSTWFKREQTCPMCRAKVSEDPTWQDGSTTFFYQLC